jgi:DNA polymerase III gamma/tau subunit
MLDLGKEDLAIMQNILLRTSEDHLTLLLSELLRAELDVRNASSPRLALEMSLLKASFLRDMKPLREVIENLEKYIKLVPDSGDADTEKISPAITHDAAPGNRGSEREYSAKLSQDQEEEFGSLSATVSEEPPVSASEGQTITDEIRERALRKMAHPLQSKLSNASFKLDGDTLILTLNGGDSVFSDSLRKNGELIAQIFSEELGNAVNLEVVTAKKKVVRRKDLKEEVMADSAIQEVLELFDGRIVDVMPIKKQTE